MALPGREWSAWVCDGHIMVEGRIGPCCPQMDGQVHSYTGVCKHGYLALRMPLWRALEDCLQPEGPTSLWSWAKNT